MFFAFSNSPLLGRSRASPEACSCFIGVSVSTFLRRLAVPPHGRGTFSTRSISRTICLRNSSTKIKAKAGQTNFEISSRFFIYVKLDSVIGSAFRLPRQHTRLQMGSRAPEILELEKRAHFTA